MARVNVISLDFTSHPHDYPDFTQSPDGTTRTTRHTSDIVCYSIYRPRKDERLSCLSWLTYSGRFTQISGHPSATGRAWDRESSPVKDQRYNHCDKQPHIRPEPCPWKPSSIVSQMLPFIFMTCAVYVPHIHVVKPLAHWQQQMSKYSSSS